MALWDRVKNWFHTAWREELEHKSADFVSLLYQPWQVQQGIAKPDYKMDTATLSAYSWVYDCRRLIAQEVAKRPLKLYRGEGGDRKEVTSGQLFTLLQTVNPRQTLTELLEATVEDLTSYGNAYWRLETSGRGRISELWRLRADYVKVKPGPDWVAAYTFGQYPNTKDYPPTEVVPFALPNINSDWYGQPPLAAAKLAAESDYSAACANKSLLDRGFRPDLIVKLTERLGDEERAAMQRMFRRQHEGIHGGLHILEQAGGIEIEKIGFDAREMEFHQGRHDAAVEICAAFSVPPMLVGVEGAQTFANFSEAERQFQAKTVGAYCGRIAGSITEFLVPLAGEQTGTYAEFDDSEVEALQDSDLEDKKVAQAEMNTGALTRNEYRAIFYPDLPKLPPEIGDQVYLPLNMLPAGTMPEEKPLGKPPVPPPEQPPQKRYVLRDKGNGEEKGDDPPFVAGGPSGRPMTARLLPASGNSRKS